MAAVIPRCQWGRNYFQAYRWLLAVQSSSLAIVQRTSTPHWDADQWLSPVLCHMGHSTGSSQGKKGWARQKLESFSNLILEVLSITFAVFYTLKDFTRSNPLTGGVLEMTWVSGGRHYWGPSQKTACHNKCFHEWVNEWRKGEKQEK